MAPLVVPSGALARLVWAKGGVPYAVNVIGLRKLAAGNLTQAQATAFAAAVLAAFTSSGQAAVVGTAVTLHQVALRDISEANLPEFIGVGAAVPGTAAGNLLPPQIAACMTLRTAKAGKNYRGRVYLTGYTVGQVTATGDAVAAVGTAGVAFVNAIDTAAAQASCDLAVVSRELKLTELVTSVQSRDAVFETIRGRAIAGI